MKRKTWQRYFIDLSYTVSQRSTCLRKHVGAVIVNPKTKTVLATGYNGSLPSSPHCDEVGCYVQNSHCIRTVHAETNAINQAAQNGISLIGAHIYCTTQPCWNCFKNIIQSGILHIYYAESYSHKNELYSNFLNENPQITYRKINVN
tara:strand:- start:195 stop:635 length:441 start_codon:yes stop_codon:yes gene_type:complete